MDVEDWFQVWALSGAIDRDTWDERDLRVDANIDRILALFDRHQVKATFFVLGWIAERCPDMIRRLATEGHEVASHGWDHQKVFDQTETAFYEDILKTRIVLQELSGQSVDGFRAAGFSIDRRTPFAYDALAKAGYGYSSSSHPIAHDHYGDPSAPMEPYHVSSGLVEIPVAVTTLLGRRQTCAGGGWFRAMPYLLTRRLWRGLEDKGRSGVFYFHPWEVDPDQPSVPGLPLKARLRHRLNLHSTEKKLDRLLGEFNWTRIDKVFASSLADNTQSAA
ncbi:polysaccharide deacetylase [Parvularcula bermudensis HTCC2503]|uniref:Chitooligosaccharide deacetylase n=1 Tax=Parvularcula bermudensis (strain ATCC BAA-594 / HTCC2503 / KCTC 12087) TaxID=314260 RepID=E0TGM6_PARBH|nr:polysaccharide deacetylase [Parvularcula bermudensis HTCC2503]